MVKPWFNKKKFLALAPLADLTDQPFSQICREVSGKNFVIFREMLSAEAIVRGNEKTLKMAKFKRGERPIVLQLFASEPEVLVKAAQILVKKYRPNGIDVNMGCPVPKISSKGRAGAFLMKDARMAGVMVKALKNANLGVPVSVKTRLGWDNPSDILNFGLVVAEAGADAITVHGRTKEQGYSGQANWEMIKKVVNKLSIPVIANGDVNSLSGAEKCFSVTQAAGVMIGRGALGNPWIFSGRVPDKKEFKKVILRHAKLHIKRYGPKGLVTFRKHLLYYFRADRLTFSITEIKKIRVRLAQVSEMKELKKIIKSL